MSTSTSRRRFPAVVLLGVAAGLALIAVWAHHEYMAEYGDVTGIGPKGFSRNWADWGWTASYTGVSLIPVVIASVIAYRRASRKWMRVTAVAIPVLMLLGILAVTPVGLQKRLDTQYRSAPQCVNQDMGGPVSAAERDSQRAFDSIEHIGNFSDGGASGDGGCYRSFVLTGNLDVLEHYRAALPAADWKVIEDDPLHLRAVRDGLAFEVITGPGGGIVWAGNKNESCGAPCD